MLKRFIAILALAFIGSHASAQKVNEPQNVNPQWSQPYLPFRIVGNLYYVGTHIGLMIYVNLKNMALFDYKWCGIH